jgi:hypothetical protein
MLIMDHNRDIRAPCMLTMDHNRVRMSTPITEVIGVTDPTEEIGAVGEVTHTEVTLGE